MELILQHFTEAQDVLHKFMSESENFTKIQQAGELFVRAIRQGNKIISCGNGGSMSDAMHFAEELSGKFRKHRPSIPAIAVSDASYLTCAANDYGFEHIFSRFVEGLGSKGDVLLAISTSGNSENVLNAARKAKEKGLKVVALSGKDGGKLAALSDIEIRVPHFGYADRIQEIHIKIIHTLIHFIEKKLGFE
ncbi:MAG: phosphoheptose isomerase [Bacteroidia bacterium]|nr:MAG: phosphoheptose isomerase [Bacteroidia bacterium]